MFFRQKALVGLDLGSSELKIVELRKKCNGYGISKLGRLPTPQGALEDGLILRPREMSEALQELIRVSNIEGKRIVTAIAGKNIFTRLIQLPPMTPEELRSSIQWEGEKQLPLPKQDLILDYTSLGEREVDGIKQLQVLLVAVPKKVIYPFCEVFLQAGLELDAVEVEPLALWRAFAGAFPQKRQGFKVKNIFSEGKGHKQVRAVTETGQSCVFACVDLGAAFTNVVVFADWVLQYIRTIPMGGKHLTQSLSQRMGLSFLAAQKLKEEKGIIPGADTRGDIPSVHMDMSLRAVLEELGKRIRRSLDFFELQYRRKVEYVVISGGASQLKGLPQFLAGELGVEVEMGNPLQGLQPMETEKPETIPIPSAASLGVAVGLALRGVMA